VNILFLGSFIPDKYAEEFEELSAAANQFQYNLYNALSKNHRVHAVCYLPIHLGIISDEIYDCLSKENIDVFLPKERNTLSEFYRIRREIKILEKTVDCIIAYNVQYPWLNIRCKVPKTLILADYTPVDEEKFIKKPYSYFIRKSFKKYDKMVILSEGSKKYVNPVQECEVIHGCIRWENFQYFCKPIVDENIVFFYSGVLNCVTGVDLLLRAFIKTKDRNYRLILCGQGNGLNKQIHKAVENDPRILFMGYVSKIKYLQLLEKANIVINPRNMNYEQNKYNFPSKILEYLASGRTIVSTKFYGWREFQEYIEFVEPNVEDLYCGMKRAADQFRSTGINTFKKNRKFAQNLTWDEYKDKFLPFVQGDSESTKIID